MLFSVQAVPISLMVASVIISVSLLSVGTTTSTTCTAFVLQTALSSSSSSSSSSSLASSSSTTTSSNSNSNSNSDDDNNATVNDCWYSTWAIKNGIQLNDKISMRDPTIEERGKGGLHATADIKALEVIAMIPRSLVISTHELSCVLDKETATNTDRIRAVKAAANANTLSWATDLTASTLVSLYPTMTEDTNTDHDAVMLAKKEFIRSWTDGGWGTNGVPDLGPPDANFGNKHVTGSLLSTGSDNDKNIYAKFRMPCHPVLQRASLGLAMICGYDTCTEEEARNVLTLRGSTYRSMRDALVPLVILDDNEEDQTLISNRYNNKGSKREQRCWDVADTLSKVCSRVTTIQNNDDDDISYAIVPIHERLEHSFQENTKLVTSASSTSSTGTDNDTDTDTDTDTDDNDRLPLLLLATRDIQKGEAVTRDYSTSPKLMDDPSDDDSALRLLMQFGIPPSTST